MSARKPKGVTDGFIKDVGTVLDRVKADEPRRIQETQKKKFFEDFNPYFSSEQIELLWNYFGSKISEQTR